MRPCIPCSIVMSCSLLTCRPVQAAIWLVCKKALRREDLYLPVSLFGIHLALGNMWNGA